MTDPAELIAQWPVAAAAAWSDPDDPDSTRTFGPIGQSFRLASVTKPIFAWAVLVAVEEGTLSLDAPVGPADDPYTIRHLLSHASGLGPERDDRRVAPETRRIYSNAGFEALASALEHASGITAASYFREAVCEPLGMRDTWLEGSAAHGATSTVTDLTRFVDEVRSPELIHRSTRHEAISPAFADLDGVLPGFGMQRPNPWGLGFEIRGSKAPHWTTPDAPPETFGHFGASGTFLWVEPASGRFAVVLTDTAFGGWATERWPTFNAAVLGRG